MIAKRKAVAVTAWTGMVVMFAALGQAGADAAARAGFLSLSVVLVVVSIHSVSEHR